MHRSGRVVTSSRSIVISSVSPTLLLWLIIYFFFVNFFLYNIFCLYFLLLTPPSPRSASHPTSSTQLYVVSLKTNKNNNIKNDKTRSVHTHRQTHTLQVGFVLAKYAWSWRLTWSVNILNDTSLKKMDFSYSQQA